MGFVQGGCASDSFLNGGRGAVAHLAFSLVQFRMRPSCWYSHAMSVLKREPNHTVRSGMGHVGTRRAAGPSLALSKADISCVSSSTGHFSLGHAHVATHPCSLAHGVWCHLVLDSGFSSVEPVN